MRLPAIIAREQEEMERTVLARLMDSMTRLYWLIPVHGIVNPVKMINVSSVKLLIKILATIAKEREDRVQTAHAHQMATTTLLFLLIHLHGTAEHVQTINVFSVS